MVYVSGHMRPFIYKYAVFVVWGIHIVGDRRSYDNLISILEYAMLSVIQGR